MHFQETIGQIYCIIDYQSCIRVCTLPVSLRGINTIIMYVYTLMKSALSDVYEYSDRFSVISALESGKCIVINLQGN